jgi:hypothetical protein
MLSTGEYNISKKQKQYNREKQEILIFFYTFIKLSTEKELSTENLWIS